MRRAIGASAVAALTALAACSAAHGPAIEFTGLPCDNLAMTLIAHDYARYVAFTGPLSGEVDLRAPGAFVGCSLATPEKCPHEFGVSFEFVIVSDYTGSGPAEVAYTAYVHELTHAMFGDPNHDRPDLWGYTGTVRLFNAQLAGKSNDDMP